jgi:hypothetical protein
MLDPDPVAWIIAATWIIGLGLIALIRAWIRRNETRDSRTASDAEALARPAHGHPVRTDVG